MRTQLLLQTNQLAIDAHQQSTQTTYKRSIRIWLEFCLKINHDSSQLPTTEILAAAATNFSVNDGRSHTSVAPYMSAIQNYYTLLFKGSGTNLLPIDDKYFLLVKKGIKNTVKHKHTVHRATCFTMTHLKQMCGQPPITYIHAMYSCIASFMFWGLLRIQDIADPLLPVFIKDITISQNAIILHRMKRKWHYTPCNIKILKQTDFPCPLRAYQQFRLLRGNVSPQDKAFVITPSLSSNSLVTAKSLQDYIKNLKLKPTISFTTHSFRRGGASFMISKGVPVEQVKSLGMWSDKYKHNEAFQKYVDYTSSDFQ